MVRITAVVRIAAVAAAFPVAVVLALVILLVVRVAVVEPAAVAAPPSVMVLVSLVMGSASPAGSMVIRPAGVELLAGVVSVTVRVFVVAVIRRAAAGIRCITCAIHFDTASSSKDGNW